MTVLLNVFFDEACLVLIGDFHYVLNLKTFSKFFETFILCYTKNSLVVMMHECTAGA